MRIKPTRYTGRGDLHFVTFSWYQRRPLLGSIRARNLFVKILDEVRAKYEFRILGYVVMPEHVHLLMSEPARLTPSQALQILKQRVSRQIRSENLSEQELQRFWQRRFYDFNVYTLAKMKEKLEYMHANPVNRKLAGSATEWPWSSCSHYATGAPGLIAIETLEETCETESTRGTA